MDSSKNTCTHPFPPPIEFSAMKCTIIESSFILTYNTYLVWYENNSCFVNIDFREVIVT